MKTTENGEAKTMKPFSKLGFSSKDSDKVVDSLNILLANYQVHYQKLRDFHWNVKGSDFFDLHEQFEIEYNEVKLNIDAVAERVRVFGKHPLSTMQKYLDTSTIEEAERGHTGDEMVAIVLEDFETLLSFMIDVIDEAQEIGDNSTHDMITKFMKRMETRHWMFTAFSSKS